MFSRLAFAIGFFLASSEGSLAFQPIQLTDVIETMERFDLAISFVHFRCEAWEGVAEEQNDRWKLTAGGATTKVASIEPNKSGLYRARIDVSFEPSTGNFKVDELNLAKSAVKNDGSFDDIFTYNLEKRKYSNDSVHFMSEYIGERHQSPPLSLDFNAPWGAEKGISYAWDGDVIESEKHPSIIGNGSEDALLKHGDYWQLGLVGNMACTHYERPVRLSEYLRSKKSAGEDIRVRSVAKGLWEIFCVIRKSHKFTYAIKFFYDPISGRVTRVEWGGCNICEKTESDPDDWYTERRLDYYYGTNSHIPDLAFVAQLGKGYKPGRKCAVTQVIFSEQSVSPIKAMAEEFRIMFTPGVEVTDHTTKRVYTVVEGH